MKARIQISTTMKARIQICTLAVLGVFAVTANAAVISIDFAHGASPTHSGEPDKTLAPIHIPGQVGPWNAMNLQNTTNPTVTVGGVTFTITGVMNTTFESFNQPAAGRSALRQDVLASNDQRRWPGPIPWEFTGLNANTPYDLSFFRGANEGYNVLITGATGVDDADGDVNFTAVMSSSTGTISGTFDVRATNVWAAFGGVQIAIIPEPSTALLGGLGLLALLLRRRR